MKDSLLGDTFKIMHVMGDSVVFTVDRDTFLKYIANHGFALFNRGWQSYYSRESAVHPEIYIYSDSTIIQDADKDAYIGADTSETTVVYLDTLMLKTGMWSKIYFTLPLEVMKDTEKIISASILLSVRDSFPHKVECAVPGDTIITISTISGVYPDNTANLDVISAIKSSYRSLVIEPYSPAAIPSKTNAISDSFAAYIIYRLTLPTWRSGL